MRKSQMGRLWELHSSVRGVLSQGMAAGRKLDEMYAIARKKHGKSRTVQRNLWHFKKPMEA